MKQQGLTLIELITVMGVLALIIIIAIPTYADYSLRAKVAEGLSLAGSVKLAVTETHMSNGEFPDNNSQAGIQDVLNSKIVEKIFISEGNIVIVYDADELGLGLFEPDIILKPTVSAGGYNWDCTGGSLPHKYRPSICRS